MAENYLMAIKKQIFQLDARLKEQFNAFCTGRGLIQEQILESLVYMLVHKGLLDSIKRDELVQEVAAWKAGIENLSPAETGQKVRDALKTPSPKQRKRDAS